MAEFFRTSTLWVVDFHFDGQPRRWFKAFGPTDDVHTQVSGTLQALHGGRAKLVDVRRATPDEETQYLRGTEPKNVLCLTGRRDKSEP